MNRSKKHADRFHLEFHRQKHLVRWAKRLGCLLIKKLSVLLVQSITRGSTDLFLRLKEEEEGAFFEKKEQAKRKGEQASTKLLAPMMVMLVVILVLLMFPALSTFS